MSRKRCKCCGIGWVDGQDGSFDVCHVCGWEDDGVQNDDPDYPGGANSLSLNDHRKEFEKKRAKDPNWTWIKRLEEKNGE